MANWNPFGCLVIPHLPVRLALRQHPTLQESPLAIATPGQRGTLIDCSLQAHELGLRVGMLAREAQSLCPQVTILHADPLAYANEQSRMFHALSHVCPTLQRGPAGRINLDLRGLERHYSSSEALGEALLARIDPALEPRLGIATSMFAAFVAARRSPAGAVRVVDPSLLSRMLERFPVDLLPLEPVTLRRMERLGLRRLGDIARLPLTALVAQFGADGKRAWQLARGEDPDPFVPEPVSEPVVEILRLPAPTALEHDLAVALRIAAGRLLARPELRGHAVRHLRMDLRLEHGSAVGRTVLVKGGTRDVQRLVALLRSQLGSLSLEAAVTAIQLEVLALGEQAPQQLGLGEEASRSKSRLRGAVAELSQRYAASPLYQVVEVNRWARLPEHRWALAVYEP